MRHILCVLRLHETGPAYGCLMEQPVKFIWTHDAFRVGEDGPTHEPVEQEAQVRLLEKLKNHKGHNSMLVLRPADVEETTIAWKLAMENMSTPTALILHVRISLTYPQEPIIHKLQKVLISLPTPMKTRM